jgi:hypothetical protein
MGHREQRARGGFDCDIFRHLHDYPWWKRKLPPFVLCGCCPFIVVHSEHEDDIPDIVDLAFARLDAAGAGLKEVSRVEYICLHTSRIQCL